MPEYIETCGLTGKRVAPDELAASDVSGRRVIANLLRKSELSGKQAEPRYFSRCSFTNTEALKSELLASEISGRIYRGDQQEKSEFSGKKGHTSEFVNCSETQQKLARVEAEQCQQSGNLVRPGVLIKCEATGKKVLPSECGRCSVTNKVALKQHLVVSSVSGAPMLAEVAVRSLAGKVSLPVEARACAWTGQKYHPDDMGVCTLTDLNIYSEYLTKEDSRLVPLNQLLNDITREPRHKNYPILEDALSRKMNGAKSHIISGAISPTGNALAICADLKVMLGLKTNYLGFVFLPRDREIIGRVAQGRRAKGEWIQNRI